MQVISAIINIVLNFRLEEDANSVLLHCNYGSHIHQIYYNNPR